jgi:hypothetical protein
MSSHIICPKQKEYSRVSTHKELNQFISIVKSKKHCYIITNKLFTFLLNIHTFSAHLPKSKWVKNSLRPYPRVESLHVM